MRLLFAVLLAAAAPLCGAVPVVTGFTTSTARPVEGGSFQLCWTVSNAPQTITITPGNLGDASTSYGDATNPAAGCATFTPPTARLRMDGDSITCGFRTSGAAANTSNSDLPCQPNPNPNGSLFAWGMRLATGLRQQGYSLPIYQNTAIVGATAQGHTALTCTSTPYAPDILVIAFGANDVQGKNTTTLMDTIYTSYFKPLWSAALASGCITIPWTVTPRSNNPSPDSVRTYLNGLVTGTPALYSAVVDIGSDAVMGAAGASTYNTVLSDGNTSQTYFSALDCSPTCTGASVLTHYSDAGQQRVAKLALSSINWASLMRVTYTITGTNASGTSAPVTLQITTIAQPPAPLSAGLIQ